MIIQNIIPVTVSDPYCQQVKRTVTVSANQHCMIRAIWLKSNVSDVTDSSRT